MRAGCQNSKKGFILVTVLFIITLLLSSATAFTWFARQEIRRVSDEEFALQSRNVAIIAVQNVSDWIVNDKNDYDSALELIYSPKFPLMLPFGDWNVLINIVPQNNLIPINGLFLPDGVTIKQEYEYAWREVWNKLGKSELAPVVLDFLDNDTIARAGGREDESFLNRPISDLSELLILPEIDKDLLYGKKPSDIAIDKYFTVLGSDTININLAPKAVLSLLDAELEGERADSIVTYRSESSIKNAKDLVKIPGFPKALSTRLGNIIGYKSDFFSVNLTVQSTNKERNFAIIMKRAGGDKCEIISWKE